MNAAVYKIGFSLNDLNESFGEDLTEDEVSQLLEESGFTFSIVNPKRQLITSVKEVLGKPYKRGASVSKDAPESFDCSSLIAWAAVESGLAIPRISIDQFVFSERIERSDLEPGDLVFSNSKEIIHTEGSYFSKVLGTEVKEEPIRTETVEYMPGTQVPNGVDHVGMCVGEDMVIHATIKTGKVIEVNLNESESFKNIVGYGRIVNEERNRFVVEIPADKLDVRKKESLFMELKKSQVLSR